MSHDFNDAAPETPRSPLHRLLRLAVDVRRGEIAAMFWSSLYYFLLMASYYPLRAVRDEIGARDGAEGLSELFLATFIGMLIAVPIFSWLVSRYQRRVFLPIVYGFFSLNILGFYFWFRAGGDAWRIDGVDRLFDWVGVAWRTPGAALYFVWVSIFNLFVVSVFWGFMADLWRNDQGKRLFGFVAFGASAGAIVGAAIPSFMAEYIGSTQLLLVSAVLLLGAIVCVGQLSRLSRMAEAGGPVDLQAPGEHQEGEIRGKWWDAFVAVATSPYLIGIACYVLFYTATSTLLYFIQAEVVDAAFSDRDMRTAVFGRISLAINILSLVVQGVLTGRLMTWLGVSFTLVVLPIVTCIGFVVLWLVPTMAGADTSWSLLGWSAAPVLWVFVPFQVIRSASNYALAKPSREVLFTVVSRSEKYKAKVFIDTAVYRGGDAATALALDPLQSAAGLVALTLAGLPLAIIWMVLAIVLGIAQKRRAAALPAAPKRGFEPSVATTPAPATGA